MMILTSRLVGEVLIYAGYMAIAQHINCDDAITGVFSQVGVNNGLCGQGVVSTSLSSAEAIS